MKPQKRQAGRAQHQHRRQGGKEAGDLHLTPLELCRYTSVFRLTYEFDLGSTPLRDPDLEVCVYHDARLAEVRSFRGFQRHPQLSKLHSGLKRELDQRWTRNMMLNKWLEYCAERGHHF